MRVDVKGLRAKLGLSREDFGALLPVDKRTIRRWENGEVEPSPMAIKQLRSLIAEQAEPSEAAEESGPRRRAVREFPELAVKSGESE